jgi:hypothetical protein
LEKNAVANVVKQFSLIKKFAVVILIIEFAKNAVITRLKSRSIIQVLS